MGEWKMVFVKITLNSASSSILGIKHKIRNNVRVNNSFITEDIITFQIKGSSQEEVEQIANHVIPKEFIKKIEISSIK